MKPSEIKNLIDFIAKTGLNEVNIETEQFKIAVKREADAPKVIEQVMAAAPQMAPVAAPVQTPVAAPVQIPVVAAPAVSEVPVESNKYVTIKSPMIGTFYKAANPDTPDFAKVGDTVKAGQTVCIIEAMKLFNEIEADISGKIVEILVNDTTPVEYDTPLFLVDPS